MSNSSMNKKIPWLILPGRSLAFLCAQSLLALAFWLTGAAEPWGRSAAWWPVTVGVVNLGGLLLLIRLYAAEGRRFWELFRLERAKLRGDLLAFLGVLALTIPIASLPNSLLATWLYGDVRAPLAQFIQPLPGWGLALGFLLFPLTQGLVELPTYFGYSRPRLEAQTGRPGLALGLTALALGLQHIFIPLLFEARFIVWRGLMFLPFAFLIGGALRWRPRLLPYLALTHILLDLGAMTLFLGG